MSKLSQKWIDYTNNDHPSFKKMEEKYEAELLLIQGFSCREVAKRVGEHRDTICRFRAHLVRLNDGEEFLCPCGEPSNHRGWCKIRYMANDHRISVMKKFWDEVQAGKRKDPMTIYREKKEQSEQIILRIKKDGE